MNRLVKLLSKWKFKRIAIIYVILLLAAAVGCAASLGIVFQGRISFAMQYANVSEAAEKSTSAELTAEINKLASSSSDVVDILVLNHKNDVTYSAKKSVFNQSTFNLTKSSADKNYLSSAQNPNVVFKYVKGEEFLFSSVFNKDFGSVRSEYKDDSFYENGFSDKTVYMLSYLGEKQSGNKVYIITSPTSVPGGTLALKITAAVAMLFFMIYWVLLALWAVQNAAKAKLYPLFWGIIVLLTNLAGVIVYQLYKRGNATCAHCGASQSKSHLYCTSCGEKMGDTCAHCGAHLSPRDRFCPRCGKEIEK
ncbi:MAG: zinc ribbon domain-containing protein [Oscillospiraceae bacterium]|jgi:hypothetical protein|nr:zinc ribbon domain-containing protein [Oscillospiraceae bacterium]